MYLQQLGNRAKNGYRPSTSAQSFFCLNEYHMLAHLIINKIDDFGTILAQSVHEDVVLYILVLCVSYI